MNPYIPKKTKVIDVKKLTRDITLYKLQYKIKHDPGQFVEIGKLGIGECPISICSSSKDYIELCIRDVGNVTRILHGVKKGDNLTIRGPYGHGFPMEDFKGKNIVAIAGGTGTAPLRGVIKYIEANRKDFGDVQIFLGFRSPDDILFKKDIKIWEKKFDLNITVDKASGAWKGCIGVVPKLMEEKGVMKDSIIISVGPPIMMKFVIECLMKRGFSEEQIFLSYERLMHCGIGKCGHCMLDNKYVCLDGPVFRYKEAKNLED
ncbi:MAG: FAD/NAD(P)-binding protein [Candidatus Woesearchaeota archaeon]